MGVRPVVLTLQNSYYRGKACSLKSTMQINKMCEICTYLYIYVCVYAYS